MFKIRQIYAASTKSDQNTLAMVLGIYQSAFSYHPLYAQKIAELLKFSSKYDFDVVLLVAEGPKNRVLGFSLSFYFPKLKLAYLDYIASDPKRSSRGYGTALYLATKDSLAARGCKGLFMDVPPDDEDKLKEKGRLKTNQKRMAYYERLGANPLVGTLYDSISTNANQGYFTYLVYDKINSSGSIKASQLKCLVSRILFLKGGLAPGDQKLEKILNSISDPIVIRGTRYLRHDQIRPQMTSALAIVSTGDAHQIHHLREKGYVEKPARISSIEKGLEKFSLEKIKLKKFPERHILEVHSKGLFDFIKLAATKLTPKQLVYPNVFPIRRPDRIPKNWEMRAGYYCIDTFTPVTKNSFLAAKNAVDASLTGAEYVLKKRKSCYVLGRPPGHHAESKVFGGFCYFNNASIAANYLSKHGKVAFIDIDYHHGNGSQEIFYDRKDVFFISIHGHPQTAYPYFSGYKDEGGKGKGKGFTKNYPLFPGADDRSYLETLKEALSEIKKFKPDFLVVSLGFDIMKGDPTGAFNVTAKGMEEIGRQIRQVHAPTLVVQEGGYSLRNLRFGAHSFFKGLCENSSSS